MKKVLSNLSFAHLLGVGGVKAEEEDDKKPAERDHEDGNAKKGKRVEEEKPEKDDNEPSAENDDEEESAEAEEPEEDKEEKKSKKAKRAESDKDDDDKDSEMRGDSPIAQARLREQKRCAAIFQSKAAAKNPVLAANLAFNTRLPRHEALAVLEGSPAAVAPASHSRASRNPQIGHGHGAEVGSQQAISAGWDRAFAKANGKI